MQTYIALLRGINVGGHRKMKMADLRSTLAELDFREVQTYIQSGNIVFQKEKTKESELEKNISEKIKSTFDYDVPVKVLSAKELNSIFKKNPFIPEQENIKALLVTMLSSKPKKADVSAVEAMDFGDDLFTIDGKAVYLNIKSPYHKTKISNGFFEKKFCCRATTRNWKTMTKLVEMCS